jgi:radical SAM-linked protein
MRLRLTFSKTGPLIFTGNLDLLTIWERAARRANLGLQYSKGFHPQPKIQFASPLPLGFASRCEIVDIRINEDLDCSDLARRLQAVLPTGLTVGSIESVDVAAPALATLVSAAEYEITLADGIPIPELEQRVEALLAESALPRERRGKRYDLRPLIERLEVVRRPEEPAALLRMRLRAVEGATGRPDEVLDSLGISRDDARIERTALMLS